MTTRIATSTYSFWQFHEPEKIPVIDCIERAADIGFDAIEILESQMDDTEPATIAALRKRLNDVGLPACCYSSSQDFVDPDPAVRQAQVDKTLRAIDIGVELGSPIVRVNAGRWNTAASFDQLLKTGGVEQPIDGYSEIDGFGWVVDGLGACLDKAAEAGVTLALENHWGYSLTAGHILKILAALKRNRESSTNLDTKKTSDPFISVVLDTGNFLENYYHQFEALAPHTCLLQAKTYQGGGEWYTLDLDYKRIARIMREAGFDGDVSLEFEGKADRDTALADSLAMLREAFA